MKKNYNCILKHINFRCKKFCIGKLKIPFAANTSVLLLTAVFLSFNTFSQENLIENVTASQRTDGSKMTDVVYDLSGTETEYSVILEISFDNGDNYQQVNYVSGDVGMVAPSDNLQIVWDAGAEFPYGFYSETMKVKVTATTDTQWQCGDPFTDTRDGQQYETVLIGAQCWMSENLNIGTMINGSSNQTDNGTIEKYCYGNNTSNCDVYGGLYQWNEMMQYTTTPGVQGICPEGWKLPTDDEWKILEGTVDSQYGVGDPEWDGWDWRGYDAGTNLKQGGSSGFEALLAGNRNTYGSFNGLGSYAYFWSSSESGTGAWHRTLYVGFATVYRNNYSKTFGFSVRCMRDIGNQPPETPSSPNPEDEAENQSIESNISWTCSDPEGDPLTYDVYFGTEATPTQVATGQTETNYEPGTLENETEYFWKIVAHDDHSNTTEGPVWSFTTETGGAWQCGDPFTDTRDGQQYETVLIGTQCWMAENLNIGTMINGSSNQTDNGTIEKYCYDNDPANCDIYGGLYQWNEMMQYTTTPGVQGICPVGWHLPTDVEWATLVGFLGGSSIAGGKMKEAGYAHWNSPNIGATNESGFTALPGGYRSTNGNFLNLGYNAFFWSSTEYNTNNAWTRNLYYNSADVYRYNSSKDFGFSVRCFQDN